MSNQTEIGKKDEAFVAYLQQFSEKDNLGALAALRRGLGKAPGTAPEMYQYVVPWLGERASKSEERAYYLVASLFAWCKPQAGSQTPRFSNFGTSFRGLRTDDNAPSLEKRFMGLLACRAEDLYDHLRQAIGLLRGQENIPINWLQLLRDIKYWDHQDRRVQRRWAKEFWGQTEGKDLGEQPDGQE